ncbi:MAG TPA: class I SAM-dependent methyltransferase [Pyrinomonadaceae bacterium]|jgi:ubiquinone/menaquinone biosynthesis C-methylase UbiE|nr:class I SAM-dependent methyltransferase [Pyrinomonadaceae bacterium]
MASRLNRRRCPTILAANGHEIVAPLFACEFICAVFLPPQRGIMVALHCGMLEPSFLNSHSSSGYSPFVTEPQLSRDEAALSVPDVERKAVSGLVRRLRRERRRRKVGRAYDMALEIARAIPNAYEILDVGCGNGYIAQHLAGLLGSYVLGIDVDGQPEAPVNFRRYDGKRFPAGDRSFEAVLFCYVLHHAQDVATILSELKRVLRDDGLVVIYEDIPATWWDRLFCEIHNRQWRGRTGKCTFRGDANWREMFEAAGFEIVQERSLSRWRNLAHPVQRHFFLLRLARTRRR